MKPRTMKLFNATPSLAKLIISTSLAMVSGLLSHNAYALNNILKLDRIVAIVDNHVITEQELDNKVLTVSNRLEKKGQNYLQNLYLENKSWSGSLLIAYSYNWPNKSALKSMKHN